MRGTGSEIQPCTKAYRVSSFGMNLNATLTGSALNGVEVPYKAFFGAAVFMESSPPPWF